ncbi:hypothetical protein CMO83_05120 [Candidatus Woesearchaeota archaeon]|jgi:proteasome lid subunit RPN8/RPN11|nr:hypothetical protein [Candidatus Woesearchaeota archaeon]|tara:strand:+ start:29004 stop:29582 length:579 start_codon:yes stop_codon:yes gene_type:complete
MDKADDNIIPDDFSDSQDIPPESKFSKIIKKSSIVIISLVMVFLIISYVLPRYSIFRIIAGQLNSYEVDDNVIILKNNQKIIFENNTYDELLGIYLDNQEHEFKACLIGNKQDNNYHVEKIEIPKIFSQTFSSVSAEPCEQDAIISLHSHPFKSCFLSVHDVRGYRFVRDINEDAIIGIMCESNRFNFYGYG